jgi:hypothetical protein
LYGKAGVEQLRMSANTIAEFGFRFDKRSGSYRTAKIVTMIDGRNAYTPQGADLPRVAAFALRSAPQALL